MSGGKVVVGAAKHHLKAIALGAMTAGRAKHTTGGSGAKGDVSAGTGASVNGLSGMVSSCPKI